MWSASNNFARLFFLFPIFVIIFTCLMLYYFPSLKTTVVLLKPLILLFWKKRRLLHADLLLILSINKNLIVNILILHIFDGISFMNSCLDGVPSSLVTFLQCATAFIRYARSIFILWVLSWILLSVLDIDNSLGWKNSDYLVAADNLS